MNRADHQERLGVSILDLYCSYVQLKNISQIEHSRHRSPTNFLVNVVGGLTAFCHQPKKPLLGLFADALRLA
jgi:hypothetical protein